MVTQPAKRMPIRVSMAFDFVPGLAEGLNWIGGFSLECTEPQLSGAVISPPLELGTAGMTSTPMRIFCPTIINPHIPQLGIYGSEANPIQILTLEWSTNDVTPLRWISVRVSADTVSLFSVWNAGFPSYRVDDPTPAEIRIRVRPEPCYADCDTATGLEVLDIFDFLCFGNRFVVADPYACDCNTATGPGICDIFDFLCFQNAFAAGCD